MTHYAYMFLQFISYTVHLSTFQLLLKFKFNIYTKVSNAIYQYILQDYCFWECIEHSVVFAFLITLQMSTPASLFFDYTVM